MMILFLEDDKIAVDFMIRLLKRDGLEFEYAHVSTKREFIQRMSSADLLIVDCSIVDFPCEDALLMWHSMGEKQPFIIVSGTISSVKGTILHDIGATAFISKSTPELLYAEIKKALENKTFSSGD